MKRLLRPIPFFMGLAAGLLGLAWLGSTVESSRLKSDFVRVHQRIDIESGYYLTAGQMISIVRARLSADTRVYVIVGGSSVANGVGQPQSDIWTRYLQDLLGPQFRVINFALRSGNMFTSGNVAAEWLLTRSLPVIYVGTVPATRSTPDLTTRRHSYLLFDAWHRGYLLPWPPRDRVLRNAAFSASPSTRSAALGAALNSYLFFNDFWSYFTYEFATLNWNFLLQPRWYRPRSWAIDPEAARPFEPPDLGALERRMRDLSARADAAPDPPSRRASIEQDVDLAVPARLRAVTLGVVNLQSPFYWNRLDPARQAELMRQALDTARALEEAGMARGVAPAMNFTADDYVDNLHLSVAGGAKLARAVAPEVSTLARKLGYLP